MIVVLRLEDFVIGIDILIESDHQTYTTKMCPSLYWTVYTLLLVISLLATGKWGVFKLSFHSKVDLCYSLLHNSLT